MNLISFKKYNEDSTLDLSMILVIKCFYINILWVNLYYW